MALLTYDKGAEYVQFIGEVVRAPNPTVEADLTTFRYDVFLRNTADPAQVIHAANIVPQRRWENVRGFPAREGEPATAIQTKSGLYVYVDERLRFTEQCE